MFKKRRIGNFSKPCLNLKTCHSIGLVNDLNECEQETIKGGIGIKYPVIVRFDFAKFSLITKGSEI